MKLPQMMILGCICASASGSTPVIPLAPDTLVDATLAQMTLDEKIAQLNMHIPNMYEASGLPRLKIPALKATDGPRGPRVTSADVCFPSALAIAATWDEQMSELMGATWGLSMREGMRNFWFGPGVNMIKHPQAGRNFEYLGEDPYLAGKLAASSIRGIQSNGIIATPKHFACNSYEIGRTTTNPIVAERPLREIYLRAFQYAVKQGGALSVMTAYNRLNNQYASSNYSILGILRNEWGFQGTVVSDFGAKMESTADGLKAGTNLELFGDHFFSNAEVKKALADGSLSLALIDQRVRESLRVRLSPWLYTAENAEQKVDRRVLRDLAVQAGRKSLVLLKNTQSVLPITATQSVAVIGPFADDGDLLIGNQGSGTVHAEYHTTPLQELSKRMPGKISYAKGCGAIDPGDGVALAAFPCTAEYYSNLELQGKPVLVRQEPSLMRGTFEVSAGPAKRNGVLGSALGFDGQLAYNTGQISAIPAGGEMSLSAWVYCNDQFPNWAVPIISARGADDASLSITANSVTLSDGHVTAQVAINIETQKWVHILVTLQANQLSVTVNGTVSQLSRFDGGLPSMELALGGDSIKQLYASCLIDEVAVYQRALTTDEKSNLYGKQAVTEGRVLYNDCELPPLVPNGLSYPGITDLKKMSARWTGRIMPERTGRYAFNLDSNGGIRFRLNGKMIYDQWDQAWGEGSNRWVWLPLVKGKAANIEIEFSNCFDAPGYLKFCYYQPPVEDIYAEARRVATGKDVALVFVGVPNYPLQGEANDRESYDLPGYQEGLIDAVSSVNPNTVVVLHSAGGVDMRHWIGKVKGLVEAFHPGQEAGPIEADVLTGVVSPSGKLPLSYPKFAGQLPFGVVDPNYKNTVCEFGYRFYDKNHVNPQFTFGYGLSYTKFAYSDIQIEKHGDRILISCKLRNTGSVAGDEVVQLYIVAPKGDAERPVRELKGFQRVSLRAGETKQIHMNLDSDSFSIWHPVQKCWMVPKGSYIVELGSGSRDIRLKSRVVWP